MVEASASASAVEASAVEASASASAVEASASASAWEQPSAWASSLVCQSAFWLEAGE